MGKPFEVTYAPTTWNSPAGGVPTSWSDPYAGLNVQAPANLISPADTPDMNNFMFRNRELRTRPNFRTYLPSPDGNPMLGVGSFLSKSLVWHTFCFTVNGLYQLQPGVAAILAVGGNPWILVGGPQLSGATYVRWRVFQSILYYTGNNGHVSAWDGAALTPISDIAFTGTGTGGLPPATTTLIGAQYIGELDNHLILASTSETTVTSGVASATATFPQRIRWSNSGFNPILNGAFGANLGNGATFDPTVNVNAGLDDFLDVPDIITGILFIGRSGYVLRQNGITEIDPTGNGTAPFDFNHMWASEQGVGNLYTAGVAQYGDTGVFISTEDIYKISPSALNPIGRGARDAIMADLALTAFSPTAVITPALTLGYTYLTYQLYIALPTGDTRVYVLSLEDNSWAKWTISGVQVGTPSKCWIGDTAIVTTSQQVSVGGKKSGGGSGGGVPGGGGEVPHEPRCFTPNTLLVTPSGEQPISQIRPYDIVLTTKGWQHVHTVLIHWHSGPMLNMGNDQGVTLTHHLLDGDKYVPANAKFHDEVFYEGEVFNLHIDTEDEEAMNFVLSNGEVAHNFLKE